MMDEYNEPSKKWSLEEIDELLQDSGVLPKNDDILTKEAEPEKKVLPVDPRPVRNDEIKHNIKSPEVIRSGGAHSAVHGAMESDKYRDRFYNKPAHNLEKTAEHKFIPLEEQKYEREGFVKCESEFEKEDGLDPMPTLVLDNLVDLREKEKDDAVSEGHTKTVHLKDFARTDGNAVDVEIPPEDDGQMVFDGFDDDSDVEKADEEEIERKLKESRKAIARDFVSETSGEKDGDAPVIKFGVDEYRTVNDKERIALSLEKKTKVSLFGMAATYVLLVAATVLTLISCSGTDVSRLLVFALMLIGVGACFTAYPITADGLKSLAGFKFNRNSACIPAIAVSIVQNVFLLMSSSKFDDGVPVFTAAAILPLAFNMTAKYLEDKRILGNFRVITARDMYSIGAIDKKSVAFEIGRGLLLDDPVILSSQKTHFPSRFLELSKKYYPSDEVCRRLFPIGIAVSLLIGVAAMIITKDVYMGVSALSAALCASVPCFAFLSDSFAIGKIAKKLNGGGAMVSGWQAYKECCAANAVAIDSGDIFDRNGGNVYGIHLFYDMKVDEAILDTAALLVKSGGPLGNLFKRVILDKTTLLPPVESLVYEDKLGLSAWILNRRVLVGSSDLLKNHNVEIPDKAFVDKFVREGRYPLYLAVEGKAAAVFIVSYDVANEAARYVRNIERNSISLLIRTDDSNINDDMVAKNLRLPQSGLKVLSAVSGDIYKTYREEISTAADAELMHDGRSISFLRAINAVLSLGNIKRIMTTLQIVAFGIGLAFSAILSFVAGVTQLCGGLIIMECVFAAVGLAAAKFKRK